MKELKIIAIATVIAICIMVSCAFAMPASAEGVNPEFGEFYPRLTIVMNRMGDTVICRDKDGNLWEFFCDTTDTWAIGDICNLMMWNRSKDVTEHEIIEVYWEGYTDSLASFFSLNGWR